MELFIPGPAGRLQALYDPAEGPPKGGRPRAAAVVCHPHPLYGGTMNTTVVFRTARALREAGAAVLRINFRGVGESEGEHHGEGGEVLDAAAGLDWLQEQHPGVPLWAAGFSFGARTVAALALGDERVERLICIALPVLRYPCENVDRIRQPAYFLFAGGDEFGTLTALRERFPDLPSNFELDEIPGTDHFFKRETPELEERIKDYAQRSIEAAAVPFYPAGKLPSIRRLMMPRDTNALGTIFGGVILAEIDLAAAIEAHRHHPGRIVTVAMDQVVFKAPVFTGDLVSFFTETLRIGRTSITVKVVVWAERRFSKGDDVHVTEAVVTMVAVDENFEKVPVRRGAGEPEEDGEGA